jgi:enoyl-CoA hydratase/carnithine racemase
MIIASRSARFSFPEGLVGIRTLQGGVHQIAERIGRTKAIELAFLSDPVPAEQLAQWNVVNRVVDDEALVRETDALAKGSRRALQRSMRPPKISFESGDAKASQGPARRSTTFRCRYSGPTTHSGRCTTSERKR